MIRFVFYSLIVGIGAEGSSATRKRLAGKTERERESLAAHRAHRVHRRSTESHHSRSGRHRSREQQSRQRFPRAIIFDRWGTRSGCHWSNDENVRCRGCKLNRPFSIPFCLLLLLSGESCLAVDPSKEVTQYAHAAWRIQDGFFNGLPTAIAPTTDGYLWIGTLAGLLRFDGVRFVPWKPTSGKELSSSHISALLMRAG